MRFFDVLKKKTIMLSISIFALSLGLTACGKSGINTSIKKAETRKLTNVDSKGEYEKSVDEKNVDSTEDLNGSIVVYIYGEINKPDVYTLDKDSRLCNLVKIAGGYTDKAAIYLNLAAKLNDGDQIKVLSKEEYKNNNGQNNDGSNYGLGEIYPEGDLQSEGIININTADVTKLMELPGIGESKAGAIVEYRESNGAYTDINDIKNVSGIGEALFERIKEKIEV